MTASPSSRLRGFRGDSVLALTNWLLAWPFHPVRALAMARLGGVELDPSATIQRRVRLTTRRGVVVGARSVLNMGVVLDGRGGLRIGADTNISRRVELWTADHDPDSPDFAGRLAPVEIGSRVWLATGVIVLPGSVVEDGAVVGAGSVLNGLAPRFTVNAGVPCRPLRSRSSEAQQQLPRYRRWWQ